MPVGQQEGRGKEMSQASQPHRPPQMSSRQSRRPGGERRAAGCLGRQRQVPAGHAQLPLVVRDERPRPSRAKAATRLAVRDDTGLHSIPSKVPDGTFSAVSISLKASSPGGARRAQERSADDRRHVTCACRSTAYAAFARLASAITGGRFSSRRDAKWSGWANCTNCRLVCSIDSQVELGVAFRTL